MLLIGVVVGGAILLYGFAAGQMIQIVVGLVALAFVGLFALGVKDKLRATGPALARDGAFLVGGALDQPLPIAQTTFVVLASHPGEGIPTPRRLHPTAPTVPRAEVDPLLAARARTAALAAATATTLAVAVPALAATTVNEKLSDFKITGASSASHGTVTFKVKNSADEKHEFVVIKTATKASKLKTNSDGEASEKGKVDEVTVGAGKTKSLTLTLKKGHYALICTISDHYSMGMHKDFTVN